MILFTDNETHLIISFNSHYYIAELLFFYIVKHL